MPAFHAETQMDPGVAHLEAFFAAVGVWRDFTYFVEMGALCCHGEPPKRRGGCSGKPARSESREWIELSGWSSERWWKRRGPKLGVVSTRRRQFCEFVAAWQRGR